MELLQILFFHLLMLSSFVHSQNQCPTSFCGNNTFQIRYPFKLQGQQPQNCDFTDVKCNISRNIAVLDHPLFEDFYIRYIDYDSSTVKLYDPNNCLPRRLMNVSIQDYYSPFVTKNYQIFTFFNCPLEVVRTDLTAIECLSNYSNAVVVTNSSFSSLVMEAFYGCSFISTSEIPVSWFGTYEFDANSNNLVLTWDVPVCKDCTKKGGWKVKVLTKFLAFVLMIPAIAILLIVLFVCITCCIRMVDNFTRQRDNATHHSITAQTITLSTIFTTSTALDDSKIKSCSEVVVFDVNENGNFCELSENHSCPICLEIYCCKERLRRLNSCKHYFHAECVDRWFEKNRTCPTCRVSVVDVNL